MSVQVCKNVCVNLGLLKNVIDFYNQGIEESKSAERRNYFD